MALGFQFGAFQSVGFQDEPGVAPPVVLGQTPAGRRTRLRRRFVLEVEGRDVLFESVETLLAFLTARVAREERAAVKVAQRDARRILRARGQPPQVVVPRIAVETQVEEARIYLEEAQARVDRIYRNALGAALAREAEELEDITAIAGML